MNIHGGRMTMTLGYKNITPFILLGVKSSVLLERQTETNGDGRKRRQAAIFTHNVLSALWDSAPVTDRISSGRKLRLTQDGDCPYLTSASAFSISQRIPFPFNHVTASVYLHMCVLCREISDCRLGQGSIYNI